MDAFADEQVARCQRAANVSATLVGMQQLQGAPGEHVTLAVGFRDETLPETARSLGQGRDGNPEPRLLDEALDGESRQVARPDRGLRIADDEDRVQGLRLLVATRHDRLEFGLDRPVIDAERVLLAGREAS